MQDVEIAERRIQTDGSAQVLLRETKGAEREAWVSESVVRQVLDQYFKRKGVDRQQNKKKRVVGPSPSYVDSPPRVTVLPHLSAAEDLSAVACVTHKNTSHFSWLRVRGSFAYASPRASLFCCVKYLAVKACRQDILRCQKLSACCQKQCFASMTTRVIC